MQDLMVTRKTKSGIKDKNNKFITLMQALELEQENLEKIIRSWNNEIKNTNNNNAYITVFNNEFDYEKRVNKIKIGLRFNYNDIIFIDKEYKIIDYANIRDMFCDVMKIKSRILKRIKQLLREEYKIKEMMLKDKNYKKLMVLVKDKEYIKDDDVKCKYVYHNSLIRKEFDNLREIVSGWNNYKNAINSNIILNFSYMYLIGDIYKVAVRFFLGDCVYTVFEKNYKIDNYNTLEQMFYEVIRLKEKTFKIIDKLLKE